MHLDLFLSFKHSFTVISCIFRSFNFSFLPPSTSLTSIHSTLPSCSFSLLLSACPSIFIIPTVHIHVSSHMYNIFRRCIHEYEHALALLVLGVMPKCNECFA